MKSVGVVVAGEIYQDLILSGFDSWPDPGQESFAREFWREAGGGAAITACGLARLGVRTELFGVIGQTDGDWVIRRIEACGVDTSSIRRHSSEPTGLTVAVATSRDRSFFTYAGANRALPAALLDAGFVREIAAARHVHLAFAPDLERAGALFDAVHERGCTLSLDAGWHEDWLDNPGLMSVLTQVDLFLPNEPEAARITGQKDPHRMLECFAEAGLRRVALKLGDRGAALLWDGQILNGEPYPATTVDTVGAGDCFDAGFLYAWLEGYRPAACLRAANFCGALSTRARGGIEGFPERDEVEALLYQFSSEGKNSAISSS